MKKKSKLRACPKISWASCGVLWPTTSSARRKKCSLGNEHSSAFFLLASLFRLKTLSQSAQLILGQALSPIIKVRSVVLLSGGLDSAANLALCHDRDIPILAITADYGQKAAKAEIAAAKAFCEYYGVKHEIVDLSWLGNLGGSALTNKEQSVPEVSSEQLDQLSVTKQTARAVWVPNRNGVLIHMAAAFAERLGAKRVVVGFNREEGATFPDNTEEYLRRETKALALSSSNGVEVFSYTTSLNKREIVSELRGLKTPFKFEKIWSCYHNPASGKPCWGCESCQRLARALADN